MRKLDELLQDIPLRLLLPEADRITETEQKTRPSRFRPSRRSEEAPAAVKSSLPAVGTALIIAVAAAVVLGVAIRMNHSAKVSSGSQTEESTAQAGTGAAEPVSSEEESSLAGSESGRRNVDAEALYNAMQKYMQEHPGSGIGSEELMYVDMGNIEGENGEIGVQLRLQQGRDFPGTACFQFGDGELLYAEFEGDLGISPRVQIYPEYLGQQTVASLGSVDAEEDKRISGLDYKDRAVICYMTENEYTEKKYTDTAYLPWLTEWYRGFKEASPKPQEDINGNVITVKEIPDDYQGFVSVSFWDGEFVTVSSVESDKDSVIVNGHIYRYDTSVIEKLSAPDETVPSAE